MLQRLAKTQSVDHVRAMLIYLRGGRLPADETTFTEVLEDLVRQRQDRISFEVASVATLIQLGFQANPGSSGGRTIWPVCDVHCGGQFAGCGSQPKPSGGVMRLTARRGG
jgi:hypothetical protein